MKLIYLFIACFFATQISSAQNQISGTVKDKQTKENLTGVTIYITELKFGATTDTSGNYAIQNLPKGIFLVEVHLLGYKTIIQSVVVDGEKTVNFALEDAVSELSEVIVTGVARSSELMRNPVIVKPVNVSELNQNSSTNLIDALKNIPGVNQIATGAAISKPVIRGLGYNRIISLFNGVRQEGQQWGDEHGIEIDEYAIGRVEIIKGPGSLLYGSDGIGGVLNFISPKSVSDGVINTQLISNYQSNNNLVGTSVSNMGNKKGFQWQGRLSSKVAGNYANRYDGKVHNSGFTELDGSLFLGIAKKWGYSHLTVSSFNQKLNIIEGERDSLGAFLKLVPDGAGESVEESVSITDLEGYKIGFPNQGVSHLRLVSNNQFFIKRASLNADIAYQNNQRKEYANPSNPNEKELFFDLNTINYNVRYNAAAVNGWETSVGVNGMFQTNQNKGIEFLVPAYSLLDAGVFVFTQKTFLSKLTVAGGLRVDTRYSVVDRLILDQNERVVSQENDSTEVKFAGFRKNYTNVSGSAGIAYTINKKSTLKVNLSRGFRAPNIAETGSNGKHEGAFRYEYGVADLKPEVSHQIDIGYFLNTDHITLELTPFANFIQQYIYLEKLSSTLGGDSIPDLADPTPAFVYTQGNARLVGGEIYVDIHPHPFDWLHIENSFSYVTAVQANQPDSAKYLPFIPAPRYRGELKAQFREVGKVFANTYIKFGMDYFFAQNQFFAAYGTETATPDYFLVNAGCGADIKSATKKTFLSVFVSADNLADIGYQSHLSRLKYAAQNSLTERNGVFNMGRNVSVKLILNI